MCILASLNVLCTLRYDSAMYVYVCKTCVFDSLGALDRRIAHHNYVYVVSFYVHIIVILCVQPYR